MKKINKRKIQKYIRMIILLIFFTIMPSIYTTAFSGVKYIFTQIGNGQQVELTSSTTFCPSSLMIYFTKSAATSLKPSFVTILIVLCLYTIVFGRFFCGFACAFGSLGDYLQGYNYQIVVRTFNQENVLCVKNV